MKGLIKIAALLTVTVILTSCSCWDSSNNCCNPCKPTCCPQPCCPQPHIWDNCCGDGAVQY